MSYFQLKPPKDGWSVSLEIFFAMVFLMALLVPKVATDPRFELKEWVPTTILMLLLLVWVAKSFIDKD